MHFYIICYLKEIHFRNFCTSTLLFVSNTTILGAEITSWSLFLGLRRFGCSVEIASQIEGQHAEWDVCVIAQVTTKMNNGGAAHCALHPSYDTQGKRDQQSIHEIGKPFLFLGAAKLVDWERNLKNGLNISELERRYDAQSAEPACNR